MKNLGQNFLKNKHFLKKIAQALEINENDTIVEIGGGHGELSQFLTKAKNLIILELDRDLFYRLKEKFKNFNNIKVINEDFLKFDLSVFKNNYKLVGNIPYSITGKIFRKVLKRENFPKLLVFTLQKEVGYKFLEKEKNNFWNTWIKIWGEVKNLGIIKKNNFYPVPKVDSIIIKIKFFEKPKIKDEENFAKFLKFIFREPNKKLKNKIDKELGELKEKRIFELSFEEIINLWGKLK
ncbi:MAG: ribosomal RNA small subunit methyltransferase A [Patescibacteria group bacterium]